MFGLSVLRVAGLGLGLVLLVVLGLRRRSGRLLGRLELGGWGLALVLILVAIYPGFANILTSLTGFQGELARITSLLAFSVLGLGAWVLFLQGQLAENKLRFLNFLKRLAVERGLEGITVHAPIVLVMPALNEAENLETVLPGAPKSMEGQAVLIVVVDDGSEDGTAEVARKHGAIPIRTPINIGGGHALQVGFAAARRLGARVVVTLDADGQHRFEDLPGLVHPVLAGEADVVIGSRHLGESVGHEAVRALGLRLFNWVLSFLTGRKITDCSSGYRAFNLEKLSKLQLLQDRHHTAELIIQASRAGFKILEIPITILPRIHGESKKGTNWRYGVRFARTVLTSWWG
jgi:hypothetical protein